jgi:hypothetical protein
MTGAFTRDYALVASRECTFYFVWNPEEVFWNRYDLDRTPRAATTDVARTMEHTNVAGEPAPSSLSATLWKFAVRPDLCTDEDMAWGGG